MSIPFQTFSDVAELHQATADAFCEAVETTLQQQAVFRVSLSGGSTPKRLYELLSERDLPWDQIHWFWGDERNVPPNHQDSNARMVREAILDRINVSESNVHTVDVNVEDPAHAAAAYCETLQQHFQGDEYPAWDLVLLGMGDDGHTASLFPHTDALGVSDRWFVENWVEKFDAYRYTLTAPAINSGKRIWFLVSGANKRSALKCVLDDLSDPHQYPSKLIQPTKWFMTQDTQQAG